MYNVQCCMLNRSLSFFLSVLLFYCLSFTACSPNSKNENVVAVSAKLPATALPPAPTTLNIVAVGDIMLGSAYKSENDLPADHALGSFKHVKDFLKQGRLQNQLHGAQINKHLHGLHCKKISLTGNMLIGFPFTSAMKGNYHNVGFRF